ncbi:hypothetical protein EDB89DRAFT_1915119 [Lactarius sanguifluus]|nr:hypothetical protein EDB89DRAFT_1915119 [Lactarius sanguifluus]
MASQPLLHPLNLLLLLATASQLHHAHDTNAAPQCHDNNVAPCPHDTDATLCPHDNDTAPCPHDTNGVPRPTTPMGCAPHDATGPAQAAAPPSNSVTDAATPPQVIPDALPVRAVGAANRRTTSSKRTFTKPQVTLSNTKRLVTISIKFKAFQSPILTLKPSLKHAAEIRKSAKTVRNRPEISSSERSVDRQLEH